jgi:hypothetical protein
MQIDKKLYIEINEYCKLNNIKTRDFIHNILKEGFLKEKYGDRPFFMQEKNIETEQLSEIKDEKLDVVLKVAEKTFGIISSTVTPDNNTDTTIVMPEEWFKPKEKEGESENIKPTVKRKRKLS